MTTAAEGPAVDFAALADAAWPALERVEIDGWQVRVADGVTKRANSAWPTGPGEISPEAFAAVERVYHERGRPPLFQLTSAQRGARRVLIGRGYRPIDETVVLAASLRPIDAVDGGVEISETPDDEWLAVWWSVDGRGGAAELGVARRILTGVPALYSAVRSNGVLVAVARLALVGSWGGLYCVATLPSHRRRGFGERVVTAVLAAGAKRGMTDAWLQVLANNVGAIALYERFGFAEVDRYEYLLGEACQRRPDSGLELL